MNIFDSHCHLDDPAFNKDVGEVIDRARKAGVTGMLIAGIDRISSEKALSIARSFDGVYTSVGFHPHDSKTCSEEDLDHLKMLVRDSKVCAWGEIGLDFNRMFSPREIQEKWFVKQIEIATELDLPIILHERDTRGRLIEILKTHGQKGRPAVVHCFSGNRNELRAYLDFGYSIGITGIVTQNERGSDLQKLCGTIPMERLLIETDAPYLTPLPEKKNTRRNEPAFVRSVLSKLARIRKEDPERLADATWKNTCRLFRIKPLPS
ncbi:MAG: hydrolase TatD [Deltaproteobacteria bacterium RBG_13_49_15]|nr:MAG: hydrolase TatD [Deltaproteobacteria bacterium RBG_13_49_15]